MRSMLFLVALSSTAAAAPLAQITAGNQVIAVDETGDLTIGTQHLKLAPMKTAKLTYAVVQGTPTIVVQGDTEGFVLEGGGAQWKLVARTPVGGAGLDADYSIVLDAKPEYVYRYQTRPGGIRCDGQPAYLFAQALSGTSFQRLSKLPTLMPPNAPTIVAKPDASAPLSAPGLYNAKFASHEPGAMDASQLSVPNVLDDGDDNTAWREDLAKSTGEGQFFTYQPLVASKHATQLRIVTSKAKGANHPQRLGVVASNGAWHVDVPSSAGANAFVADLPSIAGCVTVVLESTYGDAQGTTSIAELEVYAEGERTGGADGALAQAVADGADGSRAAGRALARRGAPAIAAIDAALAQTKDHNAKVRLLRVLVEMHDPAAASVLAKAAADGELQGGDLIAAINALAGLGQAAALQELATKSGFPLDARVAAVRALRPAPANPANPTSPANAANPANGADRDALLALAGRGPREVRQAVIENLANLDVATLAPAAQSAQKASSAGDLWRAITRRAHVHANERAAALAAMTAALPDATDYERRYRLVDGIAALGDAPALATLTTLLSKLPESAEASAFRHVAARAIAVNPRPEAFGLLTSFIGDHDPGVRLAALSALAGQPGGPAGPWHGASGDDGIDRILMTSLVTDTWPEVRRFAAQTLGGRCSRPGPAAALADSLARDHHVGVRGDALAALVQCKAPIAGGLLVKTWDDAKAPLDLRRRAVDLSVSLEDPALAAKLVGKFSQWRGSAIESEAALALAQSAAYAIGRLAPPGAPAALIAALDDSAFPEIVAAAAASLGLLGPACPPSAKAKLTSLAAGDDQQVQPAAAHAAAICGK